jgi:predicted dehydrogenase
MFAVAERGGTDQAAASAKPVVGFIGTGMMGQLAHLANYARLRDAGECDIAGVTDLNRGLAEAVAAKYGVRCVYASADDLLADPAVDAVACIQQWPNNYALVKQALEAGKSVITEKPMVGRLDEATELAELADRKGVVYAVGFMKRYDPGVELAKQLVDDVRQSGEFGPLLTVDAVCDCGDWLHNADRPIRVAALSPLPPLRPTYPDSCTSPQQRAAYDYLLNIFSHNINLCHFLLGAEFEPRAAQFRGDRAMTSLSRCGDALVTVRGAASAGPEWQESTTLRFAEGEIIVKTPTPMHQQQTARVTVLRRSGDGFSRCGQELPVEWSFFRQARGFVRAVAGQEPVHAPAASCLWDVRVMQRLIEIAEIV